jgi:hypothetical protein
MIRMQPSAARNDNRARDWTLLALLQLGVSVVLFHDFLAGEKFFAFADVGSDTFSQFVPALMHRAAWGAWESAWSFNVGMGAVAPLTMDPFTLLAIAGGPGHVLDLRIWVYLAKILAAGGAFFGFALALGARREVALVTALAYSFCGYITTEGQWDGHATEVVAYAFIAWALARHGTHPTSWMIPLSIAFAAYSGGFVFAVGIFVAYGFVAALVASNQPAATARRWVTSVLPQCLVGLLLAGPVIFTIGYQLLQSPRITGSEAAFGNRLREALAFNDSHLILIELAGFFHKNLLGVGNHHFGWMNYLESPGFYVGLLSLLVIPQLWRGTRADRRMVVASVVTLGLFILLPGIRFAAFGFGLDYFRVNNLWVSILLLGLSTRALGVIADRGIDLRLLAGTVASLCLMLWHVHTELTPTPSIPHEIDSA